MGTAYTIFKDDTEEVEFYISEMSNRLELVAIDQTSFISTKDMEPSKLLRVFMEGIKDISYWMSENEFSEIFKELETYPFKE